MTDDGSSDTTRRPQVLALDLEGTLISNAMSQIPRPGLHEFLSRCYELFPRIVIFTTVSEERFRAIARILVEEQSAPDWFLEIEFVNWHGATKDLRFIPGAILRDIVLVDDLETYVHPGQHDQFVEIDYFEYAQGEADTGLADVLRVLKTRLGIQ